MIQSAIVTRRSSSNHGTFGLLETEGFSCFISELPWRDNVPQKSCIPEGSYTCVWIRSPKFGWCYTVTKVPGRGHILFHSGNYAGNVDLGYLSNSHGCLLPAKRLGYLSSQKAGLLSLPATQSFNRFFNRQPFQLEIRNDYITNSPPV